MALTELPGGCWIDLSLINSIRVYDVDKEGALSRIYVRTAVASCFVTLEFHTFQAAKDYAAVLAGMVNQANKNLGHV
jgi:hypothetical protein